MDRPQLSQLLASMIEPYVSDDRKHVFFQSPASYSMTYPAIIYNFEGYKKMHSGNISHKLFSRYSIKLISRDPDLPLIEELEKLTYCSFDRVFVADNLYHYIYTIYC